MSEWIGRMVEAVREGVRGGVGFWRAFTEPPFECNEKKVLDWDRFSEGEQPAPKIVLCQPSKQLHI